jgi:transcriptional regulator GlxA family with amidase domain
VTEAATACGFADPSYFSKCFRRTFGHSPSKVRGEH